MAGDGCDAELRLGLGHGCSSSDDSCISRCSRVEVTSGSTAQSHQKLNIFYNGQICFCDATEIQAKAIISMANQEIASIKKSATTPTPPSSGLTVLQSSGNQGISMKLSLQRFLQKRQTRIMASVPYGRRHNVASSPMCV